jgi:hypothetical protein
VDDKVLCTHGCGMSNLEYSVPITPSTVFGAGSVSKQFTTGAVQILAQQGMVEIFLEGRLREREKPVRVEVPAANPSAQQLAEYAGTYYSEELEVSYIFSVCNGRLFLKRRLAAEAALTPTYADAFTLGGTTIRLARNRAGRVDGLSLTSGRVRHLHFVRKSKQMLYDDGAWNVCKNESLAPVEALRG